MKLRLLLFLSFAVAAPMPAASSAADRLVDEGLVAYKAGYFDEAIAKFTEAIAKDPKNLSAFNDRGLAYKDKKDFAKAIADFTEAARLKPDWLPYYNRGVAYHDKGEEDRAIVDFTKALKFNPKQAGVRQVVLISRAHAYFNQEKDEPALADLNAAIKLGVKDPDPYVLRGILHKVRHDYGRSLADYEKAISLAPNDARAYRVEAYLLSVCPMPKYRDAKKAIAYATKACELDEWKEADALETLAAAYAEAGQFDEAIKFQTKAVEIDPKTVDDMRLALYRHQQPVRELNRKEGDAVTNLPEPKDRLAIKVGQKFTARFEVRGDQLVDPKAGPTTKESPDSLWLDYREDERGHILFLWHSFPRSMQARCLARLKGYDTYFETDILPVPVKTVTRELWKEPIDELILFEFKLVDAKDR